MYWIITWREEPSYVKLLFQQDIAPRRHSSHCEGHDNDQAFDDGFGDELGVLPEEGSREVFGA